jgi:hypothetical protein
MPQVKGSVPRIRVSDTLDIASRATIKKDQALHYGCLPRIIASDARHHDLTPAELAIMAALMSLARIATREDNFAYAMGHGKKPMGRVSDAAKQRNDAWDFVRRLRKQGINIPPPFQIDPWSGQPDYKQGNLGRHIRIVGKKGFADGLKRARKRCRPEGIYFSISRKQLLRCAHLPRDGRTVLVLMRALEKFSAPILVGEREMPPLLMFEATPDGLGIIMEGDWLKESYVRVPMPLPIRSAPATAMLLFIKCIPPKTLHNGGTSTIAELSARIGLGRLSRSQGRRGLNRALDVLNERLGNISEATTEACQIAGFKVPGGFKFEFVGKHQVRLMSKRRQVPDDERPEGRGVTWRSPKKSVARVRVTAAEDAANDTYQAQQAQGLAEWEAERRRAALKEAKEIRRSAMMKSWRTLEAEEC